MKQHHIRDRVLVTAMTAALLLTGMLGTTMARDRHNRGEHRRSESQREVHERRRSDRTSFYRQKHNKYRRGKKKYLHKKSHGYLHHKKRYVRSLPHGCRSFHHGKHRYYYRKGRYYRRHHHGYEIVRAPRFYHLPRHARRVIINHCPYFVCDNVYYVYRNGYYELCAEPYVVEHSIGFHAGPFSIIFTDID